MENRLGINPWLRVWIEPRKTIQRIISTNPNFRFVWLSGLYGFPLMMQLAQSYSISLYLSWPMILIAALIAAPFLGMLGIVISSALFVWIGRWLGGVGTFQQVRSAVAWSNVPIFITGLTWLIFLGVFRGMLFYEGFFASAFIGRELLLVTLLGGLQMVVSIWAIVILVAMLAEVQKFSIWRAVLNIFLPFFLIAVLFWAVLWVVWWSQGLL